MAIVATYTVSKEDVVVLVLAYPTYILTTRQIPIAKTIPAEALKAPLIPPPLTVT